MLTLTVKWINGDVQLLDVLPETPVYKVILQLGLTLAETTLLQNDGILEHLYLFKESAVVFLLVQPPPITIVVFRYSQQDYYLSTSQRETPILFTNNVVYDKVFIDYSSYSVFDERSSELLCNRLQVPLANHIDSFELSEQVFPMTEEDGFVMGWSVFLHSLGLSKGGSQLYFPSLTAHTKRRGLLTRNEWESYMVK